MAEEKNKCSSCRKEVAGLENKVCKRCTDKYKEKIVCECGRSHRRGNRARHVRTAIHVRGISATTE